MKDIQNQSDHRKIDIRKVGVKTITYPITVLDKAKKKQRTIATVNMYVNLPHQFKGTHMSRFIEILNRFHGQIDLKGFRLILDEMKQKLDAAAAHVEMSFPFFVRRDEDHGDFRLNQYQCTMHCTLEQDEDLQLDITVPISHPFGNHSFDARSSEIGLWGAVIISVKFLKFMWLEDLVLLVENTIMQESVQKASTAAAPMEIILEKLTERFSSLEELSWYSLTVENISQGYALFATTTSENN
ncbi:MAG: hypothetical protein D6B25_04685 [Desulfobulbaceae bacterium]|nr:MAG: hypothetical protein D6B25_04685 [Desulfobulbaceae bacterium]